MHSCMLRQHTDGRWIVEELVIRKRFLETLLKDNGYENLRTCIEEWKKVVCWIMKTISILAAIE